MDDDFQAAFRVFLREVGARVHDFMDSNEERHHATPEQLRDATRTIMRLTNEMDDGSVADPDDPGQVAVIQQET